MSSGSIAQGASFAARVAIDTRTSDRSKPLLVFLYGLGASPGIWRRVCCYLHIPYIVLEYAGFGYDQDPANYGTRIDDSARDVAESGVLGDQKLILVGHSLGVVMAIAIAAALPEDQTLEIIGVNGLLDYVSEVLMHPLSGALNHPRVWFRYKMMKVGLTKPFPRFVEERLRQPGLLSTLTSWPLAWKPWRLTAIDLAYLLDGNRAPGVPEYEAANHDHDFSRQARRVRWPIHFLEGRHDPITTPPNRSRFLKWLRAPHTVRIVQHAGHLLPLEDPLLVAALINERVADQGQV